MRTLLVDASVVITLAEIGRAELLEAIDGEVVTPSPVRDEIVEDPAAGRMASAERAGWLRVEDAMPATDVEEAAAYLGIEDPGDETAMEGDTALLALALGADDPVVVTDDKPLRKACKSLEVPISGSIGVVIAAVERGELDPGEAKEALVAMDEVGARLSARLLRRAERLIDEAAED